MNDALNKITQDRYDLIMAVLFPMAEKLSNYRPSAVLNVSSLITNVVGDDATVQFTTSLTYPKTPTGYKEEASRTTFERNLNFVISEYFRNNPPVSN